MHNLAVLYAEGIDGQAELSSCGALVPQGLRIRRRRQPIQSGHPLLRGIGVEQNLVDAYNGSRSRPVRATRRPAEARRMAERLDPPLLNAAQIAVQTFYPAQQPEQAVSLRVPPGGWDRSNTTAQPSRPRTRPADPPVPNSLLSPAPL